MTTYGGDLASFTASPVGLLAAGGQVTFWTAAVGGTQVTDIVSLSGGSVDNTGTLTSGPSARIHVTSASSTAAGLWVSAAGGADRYWLPAQNAVLATGGGGGGGGGTITSVNGYTGPAVTLGAADVGLGAVNNTSDAAKPVSTATNAAITSAITTAENRANHTGTQPAATISDFVTVVQNTISTTVVAGTGIGVVYNAGAGTFTISNTGTGTGGSTDPQVVRNTVGAALRAAGLITVTLDNTNTPNTFTIGTTATQNAADSALRDRSTHTGTQAATTITGLAPVATSGTLTSAAITDATTVGKSVLTAVDAPTARTALGIVATTTPRAYTTGRTYFPAQQFPNSGSTGSNEGDMVAVPITLATAHTFDALTVRLYSAGTTGALLRLGLYADDGAENPGALIADGGTIDGTAATTTQVASINVSLNPGLYWIATAWQNTGTAPTTRASVVAGRGFIGGTGIWDRRSGDHGYVFPVRTGVTGALPSTFGENSQWHTPPRVGLRAS